jgi:hypothetical protein
MARASDEPAVYDVISPGIGRETGPDADQEKSYDEFRSSISGNDQSYMTWVFKCPEDKDGNATRAGRLEHMFTVPTDKHTMDEICDIVRSDWMEDTEKRWTIRVQVREGNGSVIRLNKLVPIRKSSHNSDRQRSQLSEVMSEVRRMVSDLETRVASRSTPASPPIGMEFMLQFMAQQQQFAATQATAQMQSLATLLAALRPTNQGGNDLKSLIGTMRDVQGLVGDMSGAPASSGMVEVVRALAPYAPVIGTLLTKARENVSHPSNPVPAIAPPVLAHQVPGGGTQPMAPIPTPTVQPDLKVVQPETPAKKEDIEMLGQLRAQLGELAEIAGEHPDAKQVVATLLPTIPEENDQLIYETLSSDNWFQKLCLIQPKIAPHQAWFEQVRNELLAAFQPENPIDKDGV